jgi:hypothetical protein
VLNEAQFRDNYGKEKEVGIGQEYSFVNYVTNEMNID